MKYLYINITKHMHMFIKVRDLSCYLGEYGKIWKILRAVNFTHHQQNFRLTHKLPAGVCVLLLQVYNCRVNVYELWKPSQRYARRLTSVSSRPTKIFRYLLHLSFVLHYTIRPYSLRNSDLQCSTMFQCYCSGRIKEQPPDWRDS